MVSLLTLRPFSAFVAPIEASVTLSFQSASERSAILAVENPVQRHQIGDEAAVLQWMANNAPAMLQRYKAILKQHGVWVVTKTYTSRRCAVAVMSGRTSAVVIGLGTSVPGLLTLTPTSSWKKDRGDCSTEVHEDKEGVVLFMTGIYFRGKPLSSKLKPMRGPSGQKNQIFRGGLEGLEDEIDPDEEIELKAQFLEGQPFAQP